MSPSIFASGQSGHQVGVDLGSANLRLSQPPHESVLQEPNILIRNTKTDRVVAIGQEAADLRGRTPEHFSFVQPVVDSVIAHPEAAVTVLSRISHRYRSWWESVLGQNFLVSIPAGAADTDIRTFANVFSHFSSRSVRAVPASLAALRGIEVSVDDPLAQMVVDIGSDVTNIGVVSQRSIIQFAASDIAGRELDSAIQDYVRTKRNLHISQIQAEAIKLKSAYCGTAEDAAEEITVSPDDAHRAIQPTIDELSTFVQNFLQSLSADTAADVYTHGVHLVGGTAALPGLAKELEDVLSISVYEYNDPATAVASGLGDICARPKLQQSINTFDPYASVQSIDQ